MENSNNKMKSNNNAIILKIIIAIGIIIGAVLLINNIIGQNDKYNYNYSESEIISAAKKKALTTSVINDDSLVWTDTRIVERDKYGRLIVDLKYMYTGTSNNGEVLVNIWEADNFSRYNIKVVRDSSKRETLIKEIKEEGHWNQPISNNL